MNQHVGQCYVQDNSGGNKMPIRVLHGIENPFLKKKSSGLIMGTLTFRNTLVPGYMPYLIRKLVSYI